jgi:hypothetical protein
VSSLVSASLAFVLVFITGFIWFRQAFAVSLPNNRAIYLLCMTAGVALGVYALTNNPGLLGGAFAVLASLLGTAFLFTWAISAQKGGPGRLIIGSPLIHFSAPDHLGNTFDSTTLDGGPILLKFFRGHW